jgi:hypothetical protein
VHIQLLKGDDSICDEVKPSTTSRI